MIVSTLSLLPLLLHLVVFDSEAAVPAVIQKSPPGGNCPNNDLGTGCLAPNAAPKACPRNASSFGPEFYAFVRAQFGTAVANMLARSELGPCGSFGGSGRKSPTEKPTKNRPVIFVHGYTQKACAMKHSADYMAAYGGYSCAELYATSYGCGLCPLALNDSMKCAHVARTRYMIQAVSRFTGHPKVDLVAFSMGVPITRKALLGGKCVDAPGTVLGGSLESMVANFVAIAGPNYGAEFCPGPLPRRTTAFSPCNYLTGMVCNSVFFNDINSIDGGKLPKVGKVSLIYALNDEVVGYKVCPIGSGNVTALIPGAKTSVFIKTKGFGHFLSLYSTFKFQLALVKGLPVPTDDPNPWLCPLSSLPSGVRTMITTTLQWYQIYGLPPSVITGGI